jgi:hypothetical protein
LSYNTVNFKGESITSGVLLPEKLIKVKSVEKRKIETAI